MSHSSTPSAPARSVLVTGATGGLGAAVTRRLAAEGWTVHAAVRTQAGARQLAELPGDIRPVTLDVTDEASVAAAAEQVGGPLDGLVNSAGLIVQGFWEQVPAVALRRQFDVNVLGLMAVTRAFLPALRAGGGRVVNIGALSSLVALPFFGPIAASKAALASMTDSLRIELRHQGVKVALVEPGAMRTEIFARAVASARADGVAGGPEVERHYARAAAAAGESVAATKLHPVDAAVGAVHHALTARRPRTRYLVGPDARTVRVARRLPTAVRDRALLSALHVTPASFNP
ncbi:SDR family NAD(P)-dependent oxidoreductase [Actinacidiphila bryophytorum]|uniref:Short-chain dehydrogenase n=2 Tax=Actinacidiphila bryophytorum TaxID=1436133 RepID=A0A9W4E6P0_9ACTN|nr:SDR family NAD(P)-dependent oxidoreductase [Actinacidiphila bryophytorum]MBM9434747.1 SDR family NAD(P)-dependent oxidoreductase [Actinacidiphila bryophytorum]CAG7629660.1 Short-chain dehydrogenase [Actinacidiphila bryophytorum]